VRSEFFRVVPLADSCTAAIAFGHAISDERRYTNALWRQLTRELSPRRRVMYRLDDLSDRVDHKLGLLLAREAILK
jgi:hypothetical protein